MVDRLTPHQRRRCMQAIKPSGSTPELVVREILRGLHIRFVRTGAGLPGSPDFVARSLRAVVFVHGCFWHRHSCPRGLSVPATRTSFWVAKLAANAERDLRAYAKLEQAGWRILVVWECETKPRTRLELNGKLVAFLAASVARCPD